MTWLLVLCLGLTAQAQRPPGKRPAEAPPAASAAWPVETISVTGHRLFTPEQVIAASGLRTGQPATRKDFEAARDRLVATGAFASVGFRYTPSAGGRGYSLTFEVTEAEPALPVRFEDLDAPAAELEAALCRADPLFGPRIPATQPVLDRYARTLEAFFAGRGRPLKITAQVAAGDSGSLSVVLRPPSTAPVIARVRFTGNQVIPAATLANTFAGVAVGVAYSEARVRRLLDSSIRPLYEARGRIRVAFPKIETEPAGETTGLAVAVHVEEGESYNLGQVEVQAEGVPGKELLAASGLKSGDLADFDQVRAAVDRMEKRLRREGYMRVSSRVERRIDDQRRTVDLAIAFDNGPRYQMGKLVLEGLDIHGEAAVKKLWALKPGQPFNADYPDYFLERVREGGVFENLGKTRAILKPDDASHSVDVTLVFK